MRRPRRSGDVDIFVGAELNILLTNHGEWRFMRNVTTAVTEASSVSNDARGALFADLDNDGDLDVCRGGSTPLTLAALI